MQNNKLIIMASIMQQSRLADIKFPEENNHCIYCSLITVVTLYEA